MAEHICPSWMGYFLLIPFRKLFENPEKLLGQFVQEGMVVLEPGSGMGYFTLPLARMVGPQGKVVALDIQEKMLSVLGRRAKKAGLLERIDLRPVGAEGLNIEDLSEKVDFAAALHVVHELPDQASFFNDIWHALKPGGKFLIAEPKGHVSQDQFENSLSIAKKAGFRPEDLPAGIREPASLLTKP